MSLFIVRLRLQKKNQEYRAKTGKTKQADFSQPKERLYRFRSDEPLADSGRDPFAEDHSQEDGDPQHGYLGPGERGMLGAKKPARESGPVYNVIQKKGDA